MTYFLGEYMGSALGGVKDMVWAKIPSLFNRSSSGQGAAKKESIFSDSDR